MHDVIQIEMSPAVPRGWKIVKRRRGDRTEVIDTYPQRNIAVSFGQTQAKNFGVRLFIEEAVG